MRPAPLLLALPLLAAGPPADRQRDRVPPATPAGPPVNCLQTTQIRETRVRDDRTIDFILRNGRTYRNVLPQACPRLGFEQRFAYSVPVGQLCSIDLITVLPAGGLIPGPRCGLGQFQPVTLAKRQ